jgi:hypothetical protein
MTPSRARALAGTLAGGLALAAGPGEGPPSFEREIRVEAAGRVAVRLDRDVYEGAREDLGDVRLLDEVGREVPYVIEREGPGSGAGDLRPAVRNRGWRADGAATAVLDFGGRAWKTRLQLRLTGDNRRRVLSRAATTTGPPG